MAIGDTVRVDREDFEVLWDGAKDAPSLIGDQTQACNQMRATTDLWGEPEPYRKTRAPSHRPITRLPSQFA